jgi:hypothetical protein
VAGPAQTNGDALSTIVAAGRFTAINRPGASALPHRPQPPMGRMA